MATILDLPEVHPRVVRWTVDEYEHLAEQGLIPKQAELLRGLVIQKRPKSPLHRALSKRLYDLIHQALPTGFVVFQEAPLRLADSEPEPEPDLSVVRGTDPEFLTAHPTTAALVIEVAVSSASLDRATAPIYAEAGIPEYWIVLGRERQIEIYQLTAEGTYVQQQTAAVAKRSSPPRCPASPCDWSCFPKRRRERPCQETSTDTLLPCSIVYIRLQCQIVRPSSSTLRYGVATQHVRTQPESAQNALSSRTELAVSQETHSKL